MGKRKERLERYPRCFSLSHHFRATLTAVDDRLLFVFKQIQVCEYNFTTIERRISHVFEKLEPRAEIINEIFNE